MKIIKEKFKTDKNNKLYWGRVYFISDDRQHKTKLIWATSFEWVRRQLLAETWKDGDVDRLVNKIVVRKWKDAGRAVFLRQTRLDFWGAGDEENEFLRRFTKERFDADHCG
ncbi:MAG: hypothetical protein WA103_02250 [Minisyncoccales bacterium]|jgi:hypothetical protein|nr:hypothetical protein [Candidatus Pacearchaeota archaeon]